MVVSSVCSNAKGMLDIGVVDVYKRREKKNTHHVFLYKKYKFCVYMFEPVTDDATDRDRITVPSQPNVLWQVKIMKYKTIV